MRYQQRYISPDFLQAKWQSWGQRYETSKRSKPGFTFQWPIWNKKRINQYLLPLLTHQTNNHCSYCDAKRRTMEFSIDHFRPKSTPEFFILVNQWENLFACCVQCQNIKRELYDDNLLKPDHPDYSFSKYFHYNFTTHYIEPARDISPQDQECASSTIRILGLNNYATVVDRKIEWERWNDLKREAQTPKKLEDWSYPFMIELFF